MRAIWKGTISFGLISIPISLFPATRREEFKFRMLRKSDLSPINFKRVAEADGKEVAWRDTVKGYEHTKGKYIVIRDEDFARVDIEATQTVDIINFVKLDEVNPLLFHKPYFMESEKGGDKAYVLLRQALSSSKKIAIAKVVIKTRQHLAAVTPQDRGLMLELMHFPEDLIDAADFKAPVAKSASTAEMRMAKKLIVSMSDTWDPKMFKDDYHTLLEKLVEEKIHKKGKAPPQAKKAQKPSNVIDLVSVLQQSINRSNHKHSTRTERKGA